MSITSHSVRCYGRSKPTDLRQPNAGVLVSILREFRKACEMSWCEMRNFSGNDGSLCAKWKKGSALKWCSIYETPEVRDNMLFSRNGTWFSTPETQVDVVQRLGKMRLKNLPKSEQGPYSKVRTRWHWKVLIREELDRISTCSLQCGGLQMRWQQGEGWGVSPFIGVSFTDTQVTEGKATFEKAGMSLILCVMSLRCLKDSREGSTRESKVRVCPQ